MYRMEYLNTSSQCTLSWQIFGKGGQIQLITSLRYLILKSVCQIDTSKLVINKIGRQELGFFTAKGSLLGEVLDRAVLWMNAFGFRVRELESKQQQKAALVLYSCLAV